MTEDKLGVLLLGGAVGLYLLVRATFRKSRRSNYGWKRKRRGFRWRREPSRVEPSFQVFGKDDLSVVENQLYHVQRGAFETRPLMNKSEFRCFVLVQDWVRRSPGDGMRVFAQVPLGEILQSADDLAFRSINAKRIDLVVVDRRGLPLIALEVQGEGHYQGTAAVRDHVKRIALTKASVPLVEIFPGEGQDEVFARLDQVKRRDNSGPAS